MTIPLIGEQERLTPTSQYLSVNLFIFVVHQIARANLVLGLVLVLLGFVTAGFWIQLCGGLWLVAERVRRARRYRVADWLRVPRDLAFSERLLWMNWHRFRLVHLLFVVPLVAGLNGLGSWMLAALALSAPLLIPGPPALLSLVKYRYDRDFRIVLFRRNSSAIAMAHKGVVMPACGLYGQVLLILDETLSAFREGAHRRLAYWWLSEMYHPLVAAGGYEHWRQVVMIELTYADFVVLDWSGEVTANMRWELEQARLALPPERILLVVGTLFDLDLPENTGLGDAGLNVAIAPHDRMSRALFLNSLARAMRRLRPEPRRPILRARAAELHRKVDLAKIDWPRFEAGALPAPDGASG